MSTPPRSLEQAADAALFKWLHGHAGFYPQTEAEARDLAGYVGRKCAEWAISTSGILASDPVRQAVLLLATVMVEAREQLDDVPTDADPAEDLEQLPF